jgi:hypothetical protein
VEKYSIARCCCFEYVQQAGEALKCCTGARWGRTYTMEVIWPPRQPKLLLLAMRWHEKANLFFEIYFSDTRRALRFSAVFFFSKAIRKSEWGAHEGSEHQFYSKLSIIGSFSAFRPFVGAFISRSPRQVPEITATTRDIYEFSFSYYHSRVSEMKNFFNFTSR